jgi:hypothetical protein
MANRSSRKTTANGFVSPDKESILEKKHQKEYSCKDVDIYTGKERLQHQVLPN